MEDRILCSADKSPISSAVFSYPIAFPTELFIFWSNHGISYTEKKSVEIYQYVEGISEIPSGVQSYPGNFFINYFECQGSNNS